MYEAPPPIDPPSRPAMRVISGCLLAVLACSPLASTLLLLDTARDALFLIGAASITVVLALGIGVWLSRRR